VQAREQRIGVNEFDVLITLDNADARRLRMTGLAEAVMFSSGGLTRLVGRLESPGLVQRTPGPEDARSFHAALTRAGRQRLRGLAARSADMRRHEELLLPSPPEPAGHKPACSTGRLSFTARLR